MATGVWSLGLDTQGDSSTTPRAMRGITEPGMSANGGGVNNPSEFTRMQFSVVPSDLLTFWFPCLVRYSQGFTRLTFPGPLGNYLTVLFSSCQSSYLTSIISEYNIVKLWSEASLSAGVEAEEG